MIDSSLIEAILDLLSRLAPEWIYLGIGLGAAVENLFPPIPADTFVVFGAFLSAQGRATALGVFLVTWASNTTSALLVYGLAHRWGAGLFRTRVGRWLLRPRQLERLAVLYHAHGSKIILASRFLPGFRALVPVFAGIIRLAFWRTALPVALASGLWYGLLVYVGAMFGRNWRGVLNALQGVNTLLVWVAGVCAVLVTILWWRTRHHAAEPVAREGEEG